MGTQDEQASLATDIVNGTLQTVANYCTITCENNISNIDVTIIGGNVSLTMQQSCSAVGAECQIKNMISTQIDNLIKNMIQQEESSNGIFSLLGPASSESTSISTSIKNQISQLIYSSCSQSAENTQTNVNVFAQDDVGTLVVANQQGSVNKASCALDTVAKLVLNNSVSNSVKQKDSSCGGIMTLLIIIAIVVLIVMIGPSLFSFLKPSGGTSGKAAAGAAAGGAAEVIVNIDGDGKGNGGQNVTESVKKESKGKKILSVLGIILFFVILGLIIYFIIKEVVHSKKNETTTSGGTTTTTTTT